MIEGSKKQKDQVEDDQEEEHQKEEDDQEEDHQQEDHIKDYYLTNTTMILKKMINYRTMMWITSLLKQNY